VNCLRCKHANNATVTYCAKCGGKLDMTADEIAEALMSKAQDEKASQTEFYAKQSLFFAIIIFFIAITAVVLSGGALTDQDSYAVPSIVNGTKYTEVNYSIREKLDLQRGLVPFMAKRK
jgi:uncharacterized membrane protein YvbJ